MVGFTGDATEIYFIRTAGQNKIKNNLNVKKKMEKKYFYYYKRVNRVVVCVCVKKECYKYIYVCYICLKKKKLKLVFEVILE